MTSDGFSVTIDSQTLPHTSDHPLLTVNLSNVTKLSSTNYTTWSLQLRALLDGCNLLMYIDSAHAPPPATISDTASPVPNPAHRTWVRQDRLLFSALLGAISEQLQPLVHRTATALELWQTLHRTFATPSRGHIKQLKEQLRRCTKGPRTISEFLRDVKSRSDALALLGKPVDAEDLVDRVLAGLGDEYQSVIDAINARDSTISFPELQEKLLNREALLLAASPPDLHLPVTANPTVASPRQNPFPRGSSDHRRGPRSNPDANRGSPDRSRGPRPYHGRCQACGTHGHSAKRCPQFRLLPHAAAPPPSRFAGHRPSPPWQPTAHPADFAPTAPSPWLLDSGASHHITGELGNLSLHQPYTGTDGVVIGDGSALPIGSSGSTLLSTPSHNFNLHNVLFVPTIKKNLLSISQFCTTNHVSVEFNSSNFQVKDLNTGAPLLTGNSCNGVYELSASVPRPQNRQPLLAFSGIKTSPTDWHSRLGHPSSTILKKIVSGSALPLSCPISTLSPCNACLCNKSHKLSFRLSTISSTQPLEFIYSDVWTSPVPSIDNFRYYVIFVDHFTHYIWYYPLKQKSQVYATFLSFKALIENKIHRKIIHFYSDNGGEFMALSRFLSEHGISHLTTPPHTPEHNGFSERRHRHIVETGLALLHHASMPLTYWHHAFSTAVYLINRLPTPTLKLCSPFFRLFRAFPNYDKLRVFGCLCYPWLRPYTQHKLAPRSTPCLFLGYSTSQSAYLCLALSTSRLYVSRHVEFVESSFPFASRHSHLPRPTSDTFASWTPPLNPLPPSSEPSPPSSPALPAPLAPLSEPPSSPIPSPSLSPTPPAPTNTHPMLTRAKNNIHKPISKLTLAATLPPSPSLEPSTITQALKQPEWRQALSTEFDALVRNGTWDLVPPDPLHQPVGCKWIFRIKRQPDGSIDRYKARLVAKGFHQRPGIDYHDTFSPVVKPTTIRLVLSIAISRNWSLHQLDVNNAFLQGRLSEDVYMLQPPGFLDPDHPTHICKLKKAIYGLKQAPRAWYLELRQFLLTSGFYNSLADTSLFIHRTRDTTVYLLVYVDDIIITSSNPSLTRQYIHLLSTRFSLKDLGPLSFFLGIEVRHTPTGLRLTQHRYITDLLNRTKMTGAKPVSTPLASDTCLTLHSGTSLTDSTEYRMVVGSLQYLCLTRPDIAYAVNKLSQFLHRPTTDHWAAVKRLLRYLCGTPHYGLFFCKTNCFSLHAFSDADWAGNRDDYTSTSAHIIYLGRHPISWSSKKQRTVARSSTEAEYRSVASTCSEITWICSLLTELGLTLPTAPVIYCDNIGATYLCSNPVFHSRMKHIALDYHFVRGKVQTGALRVTHVNSTDQLADTLTKPLPRSRFIDLRIKIGVSSGAPS